jgi:hypothetical protein
VLQRGGPGIFSYDRCFKHHRRGNDDMHKHFLQYGYMPHYVTQINFVEHECETGEVMRQRLNGIEYDGIRDLLDDLIDVDMPDSPTS